MLSPYPDQKDHLIKGDLPAQAGANYNGYYYDGLKDEATDAMLTLVVPALLRSELAPGKTIEFHAYLTKRVVPAVWTRIGVIEWIGRTLVADRVRIYHKVVFRCPSGRIIFDTVYRFCFY